MGFQKKEKKLYDKYVKLSDEVNTLSDKLSDINIRRNKLLSYIDSMSRKPLIVNKWDSKLWVSMIDRCVVHRDKTVTFVFRDGIEITE